MIDDARESDNLKQRNLLIEAAGELLAKSSSPKHVSLSDVCKLAKLDKCCIFRHFKNKTELFDAVYAEIDKTYKRDIIADYSNSHNYLLSTTLGQIVFLFGLVDVLNSFFESLRGTWREALCKSMSKKQPDFMHKMLCGQFESNMKSWCKICEAIEGGVDEFVAGERFSNLIISLAMRYFCDDDCTCCNSKNCSEPGCQIDCNLYLQHIEESLLSDFGLDCVTFSAHRN